MDNFTKQRHKPCNIKLLLVSKNNNNLTNKKNKLRAHGKVNALDCESLMLSTTISHIYFIT